METYAYTRPMNGTAEAGAPVIVYEPPIREGYGKPHHTHQPAVRRGRHRKPQLVRTISSEHGKRLASFSLIGFGVFTVGLVAQVFLVQVVGVPKVEAYIVQLVLSVQVNFLANYHWTWGDRDAPFWRSCWRYNVKRLAGAVLTLCLYPALVHFGVNYLVANALLVAALTPVNYILGHFWTFASSQKASPPR